MADNIWLALAIWVVSYCADYYLTLYSARLYRAQAQAHFAFEGSLELTPYYQADIDGGRGRGASARASCWPCCSRCWGWS